MKDDKRKARLKELIVRLHSGEAPDKVKREFKAIVDDVGPAEISAIEEELIRDGMPREEIHRLCDVHMMVFKDALEGEGRLAPPGHPVGILMDEHEMFLQFACDLQDAAEDLTKGGDGSTDAIERIEHVAEHLRKAESHYVREENVLFPYLERHGVTEPPKIMWMDHDAIRERKKALFASIAGRRRAAPSEFAARLSRQAAELKKALADHFYKENNILFPAGMSLITPEEWRAIRGEFDGFGYCCTSPPPMEGAPAKAGSVPAGSKAVKATSTGGGPAGRDGMVDLDTGRLTLPELEAILNRLPVDISFVDAKDIVRYFNDAPDRIFPRTKAVIGRTVQNCHPGKSLHAVERILREMESGKRDDAEFWIRLGDKLVHIQYFAVRSSDGAYLGCLEVSQDVERFRRLEGEKRLLDG